MENEAMIHRHAQQMGHVARKTFERETANQPWAGERRTMSIRDVLLSFCAFGIPAVLFGALIYTVLPQ